VAQSCRSRMSAQWPLLGVKRTKREWLAAVSALTDISDLDLLRECEGIVHLDPEITHGAFDSRMPEQELDGT
jgi:hypothetical protein